MADFRTSLEDYYDISHEGVRVYSFANGEFLRIHNPLLLHVSNSGEHRITTDTHGYYVKPSESWYIEWSIIDGSFPFLLKDDDR